MHDVWKLINCKYTVDGKRDAANFVSRYGCQVRRVPMLVAHLSETQLCGSLRRMHPSSIGSNGWSLANLRKLPNRLLVWLLDILR